MIAWLVKISQTLHPTLSLPTLFPYFLYKHDMGQAHTREPAQALSISSSVSESVFRLMGTISYQDIIVDTL